MDFSRMATTFDAVMMAGIAWAEAANGGEMKTHSIVLDQAIWEREMVKGGYIKGSLDRDRKILGLAATGLGLEDRWQLTKDQPRHPVQQGWNAYQPALERALRTGTGGEEVKAALQRYTIAASEIGGTPIAVTVEQIWTAEWNRGGAHEGEEAGQGEWRSIELGPKALEALLEAGPPKARRERRGEEGAALAYAAIELANPARDMPNGVLVVREDEGEWRLYVWRRPDRRNEMAVVAMQEIQQKDDGTGWLIAAGVLSTRRAQTQWRWEEQGVPQEWQPKLKQVMKLHEGGVVEGAVELWKQLRGSSEEVLSREEPRGQPMLPKEAKRPKRKQRRILQARELENKSYLARWIVPKEERFERQEPGPWGEQEEHGATRRSRAKHRVRRHWRWQACGRKHRDRRLTLVRTHVRGRRGEGIETPVLG